MIDLAPGLAAPRTAVTVRLSRSSGPGGQNVNQVATKVELVLDLTALVGRPRDLERLGEKLAPRLDREGRLHVMASEHRTQLGNRRAAFARLRELLTAALVREVPRVATRPTAGSERRRMAGKRSRSDAKARRRRPTED